MSARPLRPFLSPLLPWGSSTTMRRKPSAAENYEHVKIHCNNEDAFLRRTAYHRTTPRNIVHLPIEVLRRILGLIDSRSTKMLSLTCHKIHDIVERPLEFGPEVYPVYDDILSSNFGSTAILTLQPRSAWTREIKSQATLVGCFPPLPRRQKPPSYKTATTSLDVEEIHKLGTDRIMWLCPHVSCNTTDLLHVINRDDIGHGVYDLRTISCRLPKCMLWVRHAVCWGLFRAQDDYHHHIRSNIHCYNITCKSADNIRDALREFVSAETLFTAMRHLALPICRHLKVSDWRLCEKWDPATCFIVDTLTAPPEHEFSFENLTNEFKCLKCTAARSYTTFGFFAVCSQTAYNEYRIDVQLAVCRPIGGFWSRRSPDRCLHHWDIHTVPSAEALGYVQDWWRWAQEVSTHGSGFNWCARLPPGYLEKEYCTTVGLAKDRKIVQNSLHSDA